MIEVRRRNHTTLYRRLQRSCPFTPSRHRAFESDPQYGTEKNRVHVPEPDCKSPLGRESRKDGPYQQAEQDDYWTKRELDNEIHGTQRLGTAERVQNCNDGSSAIAPALQTTAQFGLPSNCGAMVSAPNRGPIQKPDRNCRTYAILLLTVIMLVEPIRARVSMNHLRPPARPNVVRRR